MPDTGDYLLLSGIQHFSFCRRQWALIHIESQWGDNAPTVSGQLTHERVHRPSRSEKRGGIVTSRSMPVVSHTLRIRGICDVVEFRRDEGGVSIHGFEGAWLPCPVEYKRGKPKNHGADRLQLCAQAMCLEEMLACPTINEAFIFYGEVKRRETVPLDESLRENVKDMLSEMHMYYGRGHTPRVKATKSCANCSLKDGCMPKMPSENRVADYFRDSLAEDA